MRFPIRELRSARLATRSRNFLGLTPRYAAHSMMVMLIGGATRTAAAWSGGRRYRKCGWSAGVESWPTDTLDCGAAAVKSS
jgi:hypothetical protein